MKQQAGGAVLIVVPDYNYLTLRLVAAYENLGHRVTILAPYVVPAWQRTLIRKLPLQKLKKVQRRIANLEQLTSNTTRYVGLKPHQILREIAADRRRGLTFVHNTLKRVLQTVLIKQINFGDYDLVHTFDTCALLFLDAARRAGKFTVLESRGSEIGFALQIQGKINQQYGTQLHDLRNLEEQWYDKIRREPTLADLIVTYSDFHARQFEDVKKAGAAVIKVPISSAFRKKTTPTAVAGQAVRFIFVGTVEFRKGFPILREAWEMLAAQTPSFPHTLTVVGNKYAAIEPYLAHLPAGLHYRGYLFHDQLREELDRSHVFVFPTLNDSYAMVVQEALSYNLPVITTNHCGAADFIRHAQTGFVLDDPFSATALAAAMRRFTTEPGLVRTMSERIASQPSYDRAAELGRAEAALAEVLTK